MGNRVGFGLLLSLTCQGSTPNAYLLLVIPMQQISQSGVNPSMAPEDEKRLIAAFKRWCRTQGIKKPRTEDAARFYLTQVCEMVPVPCSYKEFYLLLDGRGLV